MSNDESKIAKHTPGPFEISRLSREMGYYTNEGQIPIMAPDAECGGQKRVALVDCQTKFKRGQGSIAKCAERDANAHLFEAAAEMLTALKTMRAVFNPRDGEPGPDMHVEIAACEIADLAIAKAEGARK